jgi:peptidoglycan/LPS O-acetylase OafA/YrhL
VPLVLQQSHFPGLDGLRAISIIIVVVSHFTAFSPYKKYFNGDIGVEIFFAISGFLITSLLLKEKVKRDKVSFKNFYIRRILRIVPVAYAYLFILMLLDQPLGLNINPAEFLTGFLYIKNIPIKDAADWYTGHFWSLSVEEQFYICFPLFIVTQTNKFVAAAVVLIIVSPVFNVLVFNNIGIFYSNHALHIASLAFVSLFGRGTASILTGSLFAILLFKKIIMVDKLKSSYSSALYCLLSPV